MTATEDGSRPQHMSMHSDWFNSGWLRVLPRHQSLMLAMLMGTATAEEIPGSLDDITTVILGDDISAAFRELGDDLDSPVHWLEEDELEDADEEEKQQIRNDAQARQEVCEAAFREAGVPVPTTIRELASTMMALGIASRDDDGYWSMPEELPRPENVLRLPDDMISGFQEFRRTQQLYPAEQAIIRHLTEALKYPDEVFTSIGRLIEATEMGAAEVKAGLDYLVEQGDVRLYRGDPRVEVSAKDLAEHARFYLVPDWEHFADHRIHVKHGKRDGQEENE